MILSYRDLVVVVVVFDPLVLSLLLNVFKDSPYTKRLPWHASLSPSPVRTHHHYYYDYYSVILSHHSLIDHEWMDRPGAYYSTKTRAHWVKPPPQYDAIVVTVVHGILSQQSLMTTSLPGKNG